MSETNPVSRRRFLETSALAGAAGLAVPQLVPGTALGEQGKPGANDKIHLALIGCGGMGRGNLGACAGQPDVAVVGACDPWKARRDAVVAQFKGCKPYADYRDLLQVKDLDAVIIGTPPHWHALLAIDACKAGKDVYLQKPMTMHLGESLAVRNAVKRHNRVCQVGTQIHASGNYRRVVELVQAGHLGKISVVRTFNVMNQGPGGIGTDPNTKAPDGLDWEMWIGPGPMRPYNRLLAASAYEHCSFMAYSGGWLPGMAPHIIDLPIWALDLKFPTEVSCVGGRYVIQDDGDAPDVQEVLWKYPEVTMTWMSSLANSYGFDFHGEPIPTRRLGIYFHGVDGTMYCNYGMYKIIAEGDRMKGRQLPKPTIPPSPGHEREWLNSIRTREQPSCSPAYHCRIDVPLVLANLSLRLGRSIRFDPATEKIVGDEEAARLAVPEYREPWKFPKEYLS